MATGKFKYHDHSALKDPNVVGPGLWYSIHSEATEAINEGTSIPVITFFYRLQSKFPCPNCKTHFGTYLAENPPSLIDFTNPKALFHWTIDFHNSVNKRKNKAIISYEEAETLYYSVSEFCTAACEETESQGTDTTVDDSVYINKSHESGVTFKSIRQM